MTQSEEIGKFGEKITEDMIRNFGWLPIPSPGERHLIDGFASRLKASPRRGETIAYEVKTYARRRWRADTGINREHFYAYSDFVKNSGIRLWMTWVCWPTGQVYGNFFDVLAPLANHEFPIQDRGELKTYFPLTMMWPMAYLTRYQATWLKDKSRSRQEYPDEWFHAPISMMTACPIEEREASVPFFDQSRAVAR